ncbi:MAG TPA: hypothetical protein VEB22_00220, partial [Phycisphaerales bacterium]|nr:hypothetical protein [Phycisphaerales bacterium]
MDPVLPPPAIEPDEDLPADAAADQVQVHILCLRERAQRLRAAHIALRTTPLTLETGNTPAPKPVRHPPASHPRARRAAHHNSTAATGQGSTAEQVSNPLLSAEQVSNQLPSTPPPVLPARQ